MLLLIEMILFLIMFSILIRHLYIYVSLMCRPLINHASEIDNNSCLVTIVCHIQPDDRLYTGPPFRATSCVLFLQRKIYNFIKEMGLEAKLIYFDNLSVGGVSETEL